MSHVLLQRPCAGIAHLASATALRELNLAYSGVGYLVLIYSGLTLLHVNLGIAHLAGATALRELNLAYSGVGDEALSQLAGLTSLRMLNLDSCHATDRWGFSICPQ